MREQQELQKILPQMRQWCLLTMMLNFVPHSEHSLQALSGIQYLLRSCFESLEEGRGGREGERGGGRREECKSFAAYYSPQKAQIIVKSVLPAKHVFIVYLIANIFASYTVCAFPIAPMVLS